MPAIRKNPMKKLNKQLSLRIYSDHMDKSNNDYWYQLGQFFALMAVEIEQQTLDMLMLEHPLAVEIIEVLPENG